MLLVLGLIKHLFQRIGSIILLPLDCFHEAIAITIEGLVMLTGGRGSVLNSNTLPGA